MAKLTDRQLLLLSYIEEAGRVDTHELAALLDTDVRSIRKSLQSPRIKAALLDMARDNLSAKAYEASVILTDDLLYADNNTEQGNLRAQVANSVLDRVGIKDKDTQVAEATPLIILPAKDVKAVLESSESEQES